MEQPVWTRKARSLTSSRRRRLPLPPYSAAPQCRGDRCPRVIEEGGFNRSVGIANFCVIIQTVLSVAIWPLTAIALLLYSIGKAFTDRADRRRREQERLATRARHASRALSTNNIRWRRRGWLVMLRARSRCLLEGNSRKENGRGASEVEREEKDAIPSAPNPRMLGTHCVVEGKHDACLAELSTGKREFAKAVVNLTETSEEGIFRNVVMYV
ncbi:unnamed protein product [Scytosiphon promiscuus]